MADPIESVGKSVAVLATIVGVIISLNTLVTTCSRTKADQITAAAKLKSENYGAFRGAVARDEQYWQSLYDQFLTIFGKDFGGLPEARRAKVLALYTLAQHPLPTFDEFAVPPEEKATALERLTAMQAALLNSIEEQGASDPLLGQELARRSFKGKAVDTAPPVAAPPPAPAPTPAPTTKAVHVPAPSPAPSSAPSPAPPTAAPGRPGATMTLTPPSATGWDVDIFWCEGANGAANQSTAMHLGNGLVPLAKAGRSIAPGVTLGQIRVRPATAAVQQAPRSYAIPGLRVVHDTRAGELEAARALQATFNTMLGTAAFEVRESSARPTAWYLSAFVCATAGAQPGPAAPQR